MNKLGALFLLLFGSFWFVPAPCCYGQTDCVELTKALKTKYAVDNSEQLIRQIYLALSYSKEELQHIVDSGDTSLGLSIPIAKHLLELSFGNQTNYDRYQQLKEKRTETEFYNEMRSMSFQLYTEYLGPEARDIIMACLKPGGVALNEKFNGRTEVTAEVFYRKATHFDPDKASITVECNGNGYIEPFVPNGQPSNSKNLELFDQSSKTVTFKRRNANEPVFVSASAPGFFAATASFKAIEVIPPPSPIPTTPPPAPPTPTAKPTIYKLVWFNHFEPHMLYEVTGTNPDVDEIRNDAFKQWCKPFLESQYNVLSKVEVAGDEHFKQPEANWWTKPPYNLPPLKERWFQIMDNERWYVYTLQEK